METYFGMVRSPADAIKLFEACRLGLLPRVQRRLSEKERQAIRHGSVFVWDEREAGMRRWTDGKSWSASRVSGSFLTYREMEGKRGNGLGGGRRCAGKTPDSSRGSDEDQDCGGEMGGYTYKADGLTKQSFSIATTNEQHLHLISYHSRNPQEQSRLLQPTSDPSLRHIVPVKGLYPESSLNDLPVAIPRATMQPRAITPQLPGHPPQHAQHQPPPPHHGYSPQQHPQHQQYQQQQQPPHTYPPQQHSPQQPPPHGYSQQHQQHPHQQPPPPHAYAQQQHQLQHSHQQQHQPPPPPPNAQSYPPQYAQNGYSWPPSPMATPPYSHGYHHSASGPPQAQLPPISSHPQPAYPSPQQQAYHNAPTNPPYDRAPLPLPQVSGPVPPRSGLPMAPHGYPPHQPRVPPIDSPDSRLGPYPRDPAHDDTRLGGRNSQGPLPSLSQTSPNVPSIVTPPFRGTSNSPPRSSYAEGSSTNGAPTKIKKASLADLIHPTPVKSEPGSANTGSNSANGSPSPGAGGLGNNLASLGQPPQSRPNLDVNALGFLDRKFCA